MTDQIDLDRLAGLERAATDGPWVAEVWPVVRSMRAGRRTEGEVSVISSDGLYGVMEGPDAEFIAEMRNAAPALIERVKTAEAERDALAAKIEQVRAWLAYKPTASLHDIVAAAPSVSLAHVKAEVLREAAETLGKLYLFKDGTASIAIDPLALRDRADQIESEARHE